MSEGPIFVLLGGKSPKYFEQTIQAIKFLKKNIPSATVGIITPPGTEDLQNSIETRLKEVDQKINVSNIIVKEGRQHFDNWNNSQRILDIELFAKEYDPIAYLDVDTVILRDVLPYIDTFKSSTFKFGFLSDFVNDYPNFKDNWEGPQFIPQTTFMLFRSAQVPELVQKWEENWKEWIIPAPFVNKKDPARFYKLSRLSIAHYALGQSIYKYVKDFNKEVSVINRNDLKVCRNLGIDTQKVKTKFLSAGSSYSNEGKIEVRIKVKSAEIYERQDTGENKGDPFVQVKVGDWERHTKTLKNTQTPEWNEDFLFEDSTYAEASNIQFTLWDYDSVTSNDEIGTAELSLLEDKTHDVDAEAKTYPPLLLRDKDGNEKGKLVVEARFFVEQEEEEVAVKDRSFGGGGVTDGKKTAVINAVGATITEKHDLIGKDDPYLIIKVGSVEKRTKTLNGTQTPNWNEEFTFDDISAEDAQNVTITLWDEDTISKNDLIGTGTFSLASYKNNKQNVTIPVYDEKKKEQGKVELNVLLKVEVEETKSREPPVDEDLAKLMQSIGNLATDGTDGK